MSMGNLQRMAQQMQQEMARVQAELETATVDGSAGGGVVGATVTGKQDIVGLVIDPSAVDPDDVEMLQDLVMAAVNDASRLRRSWPRRRWARSPRPAHPRPGLTARAPAVSSAVIEPVARLIEAFRACPASGPRPRSA